MKKFIFLLIASSISTFAFAKKIKFSVDMADEKVSDNGVHIMGDFQKIAGYADDWAPDLTVLSKEGATSIYSIVLNLPAGRNYEYQFINGNLGYDVELVPNESRLIDPFPDHRWIYLDSLDNGTTDIGAIKYGKNAPAGKFLLRFKVDMRKQFPLDLNDKNNIPHVEGSFQNWSTTATILYAPNDTIFEYIAYVSAGTYQFKYINGNSSTKEETVPSGCATSGNRTINVSSDTVLPVVCFSSCVRCGDILGINQERLSKKKIDVFPNPSSDYTILKFNDTDAAHTIHILDITGKVVRTYENYNKTELRIDREELEAGIYFISSLDTKKNLSASKWIVQ